MKLLKLGVVLLLIIVGTIVALASISNIKTDNSNDAIIIGDDMKLFKEEECRGESGDIICTETLYMQNGDGDKIPLMTGRTIKETIIVPTYIEIEKIIVEEKKLYGEERASPRDRIQEEDINVFSNGVRIDIKNAKWRKFIDSNSMDQLIDEGTTTIEITPKYASEIKVGDIIAYDMEGYDYAFVHRVIKIGNDKDGIYFTTKGDNFWQEDPEKVRFYQVEGIVVGILY